MDTIDTLIDKVNSKLENSKLFYLSNDPERALGLEGLIKNWVIAHIDDNEYLDDFDITNIKYFCLNKGYASSNEIFRSSLKLLNSQGFRKYFESEKSEVNYFQTFKISPAFEMGVKKMGGKLLNTTSDLNRLYEDKISQYQILSQLPISLPKSRIATLGVLEYRQLIIEFSTNPDMHTGFVLQFARGHTGSSTVFVDNETDFLNVQNTFPQRMVKVSEFVPGVAFTLNCCITRQGIVFGGLSKQITGNVELTPVLGGTIGNDWSSQAEFVNGLEVLKNEVSLIGERMYKDGYLGLFGLDLIVKEDGSHVFIEINARQPASIPMFTKMQLKQNQIPLSLLHLAEFLELDYKIDCGLYNIENLKPLNFSQIFIRAQEDTEIKTAVKSGVYRLQGDNAGFNPINQQKELDTIFLDDERDKSLIFQKSGFSIDQLQEDSGILLLTQTKGRSIKKNDEFARIQLNSSAFQLGTKTNGELKPWITEVLQAVYFFQK